MTFDELVQLCEDQGQPVRSVCRCEKHGWQANLKSKYDPAASAVGMGATPTEALENTMRQRKMLPPKIVTLEDLI